MSEPRLTAEMCAGLLKLKNRYGLPLLGDDVRACLNPLSNGTHVVVEARPICDVCGRDDLVVIHCKHCGHNWENVE